MYLYFKFSQLIRKHPDTLIPLMCEVLPDSTINNFQYTSSTFCLIRLTLVERRANHIHSENTLFSVVIALGILLSFKGFLSRHDFIQHLFFTLAFGSILSVLNLFFLSLFSSSQYFFFGQLGFKKRFGVFFLETSGCEISFLIEKRAKNER